MARPLRVGILVNPIAGIGGPLAMKGSDTSWQEALASGAQPQAPHRARRMVEDVPTGAVAWCTVPGPMGIARTGPDPCLEVLEDESLARLGLGDTGPQDTVHAARLLRASGIDLLCFAGGDGTAADVAHAVGETVPCLGIPAGVKITSPVFTHDLAEAAWLVGSLAPGFPTVLRDITDLDEAAYRAGEVRVILRGALRVPMSPAVQGGKVATTSESDLEPLAEMALRDWDPDATHLIGAGSVCMALKRRFWGEATLLGVDGVHGDRIVATDLDAGAIDELVQAGPVHLWLSIIGGQGMLFGRGTQTITAQALRTLGWDHVHVLAPPEKLVGMPGLHIDTGDPALDRTAPRHMRVIAGWNELRLVRILHGAGSAGPDQAGSSQ